MTRGRRPVTALPARQRRARARSRLATGLLALALLLRALLPAAQALPAPAPGAQGASTAVSPWGPAIVICSALGGARLVTPDGEPIPSRPKPPSDCLVCQGLALGQVVLPGSEIALLETPLRREPTPSPAAQHRPAGHDPTCARARAPPLPFSPS